MSIEPLKYEILSVNQEHFKNVSRLCVNNDEAGQIIMDVHNNFLKFFKEPIGSIFTMYFKEEKPIDLTNISYIMSCRVIDKNIISGGGLLINSSKYIFNTSAEQIYLITEV